MISAKWTAPMVAIASLFLIGNVGTAVAAAVSGGAPPGFMNLYLFGFQWALAWWVLDDCRRRGIPTSIDHGWFVFSAWPIVFPYHLVKSRGTGGCLVLAALAGLFVASSIIAMVVWLALR